MIYCCKISHKRFQPLIHNLSNATHCRAASKAGHSVLQVDPATHYGGAWASLRLDELQAALASSSSNRNTTPPPFPLLGDELISSLFGGHVLIKPTSPQLINNSHVHSLDISPHLLYGAGPMISLLLGSGAHHYTEYKLLQGTVLRNIGNVVAAQPVPSTRAEIFRDKTLSPLQKRTLMRFIKGLAEAMEGKGPFTDVLRNNSENQLFNEFMEKEGLDIHLQRCLAHGVLLQHKGLDDSTTNSYLESLTCSKALDLFKPYLESVGRYGIDAGPFLTPLYGCGELPQAFCRSAAVFGAVQILRCRVNDLIFSNDECQNALPTCTSIEIEIEEGSKQVIKAGKVVAGPTVLQKYRDKFNLETETVVTHRCVAILDASVKVNKEQALLVFPEAGPCGSTVWALQLSHNTAVCPEGQMVLHLWCCGGSGEVPYEGAAEKYLMPCLESLADCTQVEEEQITNSGNGNGDDEMQHRPRALFAACFSLKTFKSTTQWLGNVFWCSGPSADVTFATAVDDAKTCFWQLFPPPQAAAEPDVVGDNASSTPLVFPLDESVGQSQQDETANGEASKQQPEDDSGGSGGAVDVDSDDEALQALKDALKLLPPTKTPTE